MVDEFLAALSAPWPQDAATAIVGMLRRRGLVDETIKWGNPFFSMDGHAVAKIFVAHDWINVYFYRGSELVDTGNLLSGEGSSAMRKVRVDRDTDVPHGIRNLMDETIALVKRAL